MNSREADVVMANGIPKRRSLWLTAIFSIVAASVLAIAFSQRTLTAPMPDTVDIADMTWVEVRTAIEHGYTVAIVPTGGINKTGHRWCWASMTTLFAALPTALRTNLGTHW